MNKYIVVAMDIKTGKSHRASIELESREEAVVYKYQVESLEIGLAEHLPNGRYIYSILEYEA